MSRKVYLGDAVYADHDGFGLILTTEDGYSVTNRILLDPTTLEALEQYIRGLRIKLKEGDKDERESEDVG
jgi:hypothetical protein